MSLPESPKLPKWFFLLSDALLIGVAAFIAANSARPLSVTAILSIVGCVAIGAVVTAGMFIAEYVRKQEEALDDRQRALEALSRTVATSAEQISIAAGGLQEMADLVQKTLKQAEQLPHKLQERINEFTRQLNDSAVTENETLQQEINALRASEAEKLESAGDKISKTAAELAKLEAATAKHIGATSEALAKLPDAMAKARAEAEQSLGTAQTRALTALENKLAQLTRTLDEKLAAFTSAAAEIPAVNDRQQSAEEVTQVPFSMKAPPAPPVASVATEEPTPEVTPPVPVVEAPSAATPAPETPAPVETPSAAEPTPAVAAETEEPKPPRKPRAPRKPKADEPAGELALAGPAEETSAPVAGTDEFAQLSPDETAPASSMSADGATRLLVTAYIGIGNRLFIRGDGPGLSGDKGVPLQFVSIGKWRWETSDATGAVHAKLYKNDEIECAALGELTLEAGRQTEVTATF